MIDWSKYFNFKEYFEDTENLGDDSLANARQRNAGKVLQGVGQWADNVRGLFDTSQDSALTNGANHYYDAISSAAMGFYPVGTIMGGAMKAGALIGDISQKFGGGTDQMTGFDRIADSNFLSGTPIGMINGFAGKRSKSFGLNTDTISSVGGDYNDTTEDIIDAYNKAGKKYGLYSSGSRGRTNRLIDRVRAMQARMTNISNTAQDQRLMAQNEGNYLKYQQDLNGSDFTLNAKQGGKLEWTPTIQEWTPILQDGGWVPKIYQPIGKLIEEAKRQNPRFIQRLSEEPKSIKLPDGTVGTHLLSSSDNFVFPQIQEDAEGNLQYIEDWREAFKKAFNNHNVLEFDSEQDAQQFAKNYKQGWPVFFQAFKDGGVLQQNVIPEGALHKNKHHMENADGMTSKGIPVIDTDGNQQAEIELNEIIFSLDVTQKLEKLYKEYNETKDDKLAIEAGKLLVDEILFNTQDRTGLIKTIE